MKQDSALIRNVSATIPAAAAPAMPLVKAAALLCAVTGADSALARQQTQGGKPTTTLDTVTVTARRHMEDAQSVPISITVLEGKAADALPTVSSNAAIARSAPNFSFIDNGGQYTNVANIRGVGSLFVLSPDDTSVPFNVDEIPLSPLSVPASTLDVSRIEVLRGPQGTLYGLNSQGGAVNFVSSRPEFFESVRLRAEAGSEGWGLGEIVANAPIGDVLAGRLALRYSSRDGDIRNLIAGGKDGKTEVGSVRGSLLLAPDADTSALLTFSYSEFDDTNPLWVLRDADCFPCSGLNPRNDFNRSNSGANLRFEREFNSALFTSIVSFQRYSGRTLMDLTDSILFPPFLGLPGSVMNDPSQEVIRSSLAEKAWYQEFRLSSVDGSAFMWTAGLNYRRSSYDAATDGRSVTWPSFRGYSGLTDLDLKTNSYAAFGEASVPLTDKLNGIAGLRVTHEEKAARYGFAGSGIAGTVSSYHQDGKFSDTFVTGRMGLTYRWSDTLMSYATIGRGAVAGGLPTSPRNIMTGHDERVFPTSLSLTIEAGLKATMWNGRALLNASVFRNDVERGHLMTFEPSQYSFVISTLDYQSQGAEIQTRVKVSRALTLSGGAGYTQAQLKGVPADTLTGGRSGNRLPNVPEWTGNIGADYRVAGEQLGFGSGQFYAAATYQYVGTRATDLQNSLDVSCYAVVNARLGRQGKAAGVYLFADNLTDRKYQAIGVNYGPGAEAVRSGVGKTIGIGASRSF